MTRVGAGSAGGEDSQEEGRGSGLFTSTLHTHMNTHRGSSTPVLFTTH